MIIMIHLCLIYDYTTIFAHYCVFVQKVVQFLFEAIEKVVHSLFSRKKDLFVAISFLTSSFLH